MVFEAEEFNDFVRLAVDVAEAPSGHDSFCFLFDEKVVEIALGKSGSEASQFLNARQVVRVRASCGGHVVHGALLALALGALHPCGKTADSPRSPN